MTDWPPKLTLDGEKILNLLTGDRFYSASDAALREAVLNAIDACGRRASRDSAQAQVITVFFDSDALTLSIEDNGDGMDEAAISDLFSKVGSSAADLARMTETDRITAVGEFGIGVMSYFLVCKKFEVHTWSEAQSKIGLEFDKQMLDTQTKAREIQPDKADVGTKIVLHIDTTEHFQLLLNKFPHWIRDVEGLSARVLPDGHSVEQGGVTTSIRPVEIEEHPLWLEKMHIGAPSKLTTWDALDGQAKVDILYRGVFVETHVVRGLWGMEGALHVDPKTFEPKLNREGFVHAAVVEKVDPFLASLHPAVLLRALDGVREELADAKGWNIRRWVTLWMAVPRDEPYRKTAIAWDEEFWNRDSLKLLGDEAHDVSMAHIASLSQEKVYLASSKRTPLVSAAIRVLLGKGRPVVEGIQRDTGYLQQAPIAQDFTTDRLFGYFQNRLPEIVRVDTIAEEILSSDQTVAEIYCGPPAVKIMHLGEQSAPVIQARKELWINLDVTAGREIVREICARNEGYLGVLIACHKFAPNELGHVAAAIRRQPSSGLLLGPVRRQHLRKVAE